MIGLLVIVGCSAKYLNKRLKKRIEALTIQREMMDNKSRHGHSLETVLK